MTNIKFATVLTDVVVDVIESKTLSPISEDLKEAIWWAVYEELNKEVY